MLSPSYFDPATLRGTLHGFGGGGGDNPIFGGSGGTASFTSHLIFSPSERFGYVMLTNVGLGLAMDVTYKVIDLHEFLFGTETVIPASAPLIGSLPDASDVEGHFVPLQRFEGTLGEFLGYLSITRVTAIDENTISVSGWMFAEGVTYRQVEPYVFRIAYPEDTIGIDELHFRMENGRSVLMSIGSTMDMSALPTGRGIPVLTGSIAVIAISVIFFLIMPIILLIGFLRKKKKEIPKFNFFSNGLLFGGTLLALNLAILLGRIFIINMFRSFSEIVPHVWVNYALLVIGAGFLIASGLSLKGSSVKTGRKVLYGITIFLFAAFTYVLWDWNFFALG